MDTKPISRINVRSMCCTAMMAVIIVLCSWLTIPAAVPFTMQTFGVAAALNLLGGKRGTAAFVIYLLLGVIGLPVFHGFNSGPGVLFGVTGGYLTGFLLMGLAFWLITWRLGNGLAVRIAAFSVGVILLYIFGTAWYIILFAVKGSPVSIAAALASCVLPFIVPDIAKIALSFVIAERLKPYIKL